MRAASNRAPELTALASSALSGSDLITVYDVSNSNAPNKMTVTNFLAGVSSFGIGQTQVAKATTQFDAVTGTTGATLTNVVGMVLTVVPGTYLYEVKLPGVSTANSGFKAGFKYTTAVLGSIENMGIGMTASALVVQHSTTATDAATLLGSTTAIIYAKLEGTMVVTTGGTVQVQAAQNAAHADTTSVYVGATIKLTRIA